MSGFEGQWQRSTAEPEYALGNMLREIFARRATVRVRQRFFHDADGLAHWCRELAYLAEPAIVVVASHGSAQGLDVHGEGIPTGRVLDALRDARSLRLLHFSACLVGLDAAPPGSPYPPAGFRFFAGTQPR